MKVAVLGDDTLAGTVDSTGATLTDIEAADLVVTVGEQQFVDVARETPAAPILPADADFGRFSSLRTPLDSIVEAFSGGEGTVSSHPVFSMRIDGSEVARGALDALLVTSEPARISEYDVAFGGERVSRFRADGVVVATPLGSQGYARAAGGPLLDPGTGVAVVPISPFSTQSDTWVTADDVTLTVARDDGPVELVVDGSSVRSVDPHQAVQLTVDDHVDLWRLAPRQWE